MTSSTERLSLDRIGPGRRVVLRALPPERALQSRLMLLGVFVGARADVLHSRRAGPLLIRVRNTLVAIGRDEAKSILVDIAE